VDGAIFFFTGFYVFRLQQARHSAFWQQKEVNDKGIS
jgi:hypothetical protein